MKTKIEICGLFLAIVCAVAGVCAVETDALVVQDPELGRYWQCAADPSEALRWWWGDADAAEVCCRQGGRVAASSVVEREENETHGAFAVPLPDGFALGEECLYDISVKLTKSGETLEELSATVVFLPGNGSCGMKLKKPGTYGWKRVKPGAVFAYDAASNPQMVVSSADVDSATGELSPAEAFGYIDPAAFKVKAGAFCLQVADGEDVLHEADLRYVPLSMFMFLK